MKCDKSVAPTSPISSGIERRTSGKNKFKKIQRKGAKVQKVNKVRNADDAEIQKDDDGKHEEKKALMQREVDDDNWLDDIPEMDSEYETED